MSNITYSPLVKTGVGSYTSTAVLDGDNFNDYTTPVDLVIGWSVTFQINYDAPNEGTLTFTIPEGVDVTNGVEVVLPADAFESYAEPDNNTQSLTVSEDTIPADGTTATDGTTPTDVTVTTVDGKTYTSSFVENDTNDGSILGDGVLLTLPEGEKFYSDESDPIAGQDLNDYAGISVVEGVPEGLVAQLIVNEDLTSAVLKLIPDTENPHNNGEADNYSNVKVKFDADLGTFFESGTVPAAWAEQSFPVEFIDADSITVVNTLKESALNDGTVQGSIVFTLNNDVAFTPDAFPAIDELDDNNQVNGLTANFEISEDGQTGTLTFTGVATESITDEDLTISFLAENFVDGIQPVEAVQNGEVTELGEDGTISPQSINFITPALVLSDDFAADKAVNFDKVWEGGDTHSTSLMLTLEDAAFIKPNLDLTKFIDETTLPDGVSAELKAISSNQAELVLTVDAGVANFDASKVEINLPKVVFANRIAVEGRSLSVELTNNDTTPPDAPVINAVGSDNVVSDEEAAAGVTISGTAENGATIKLTVGENTTEVEVVDGAWSYTAKSLAHGEYTISAVAVDAAGNKSGEAVSAIQLVDTTAPTTPVIDSVAGDNIITKTEREDGETVKGTAEANSTVTLTINDLPVQEVHADENGRWSYELTADDYASGDVLKLSATATDEAGNESEIATVDITADSTAPEIATFDSIGTDGVINDQQRAAGVTITGKGEPGTKITLTFGTGNTVVADAPAADEVADAQDTLNAAQAALDEAQAVIDALVATDEEITALDTATTTLSDLQTALETAQTDFAAVDPADAAALAVAQATLDDAQAAVDAGQAEVDAAQAAVDAATTPTEEQQAAVDAATTARDEAQSAVDALAVDPTATDGTDTTATDGTDPTATDGTDPTATDGTDLTATDGTDPTATDGTDSTATEEDPTATDGTDSTATEEDPTATDGTDPTATEEDPTATDSVDLTVEDDAPVPVMYTTGVTPRSGAVGEPVVSPITAELHTVEVTIDAEGNWSYTMAAKDFATYGKEFVTATITDAAGNESTLAVNEFELIDTTAPDAPFVNKVAGNNKIGADEKAEGVTVTGTTEANATISLSFNDSDSQSVTADETGHWSFDLTDEEYATAGEDNLLNLSVVSTDAAGNHSDSTTINGIIVPDTTAPDAPTFDSVDALNVGTKLTGTAEANAIVTLTFGDDVVRTEKANADGVWSHNVKAADLYTIGVSDTGELKTVKVSSVAATAKDAAGNESEAATVEIASEKPSTAKPTIDSVTEDNVVNIAESAAVDITGKAEVGATVTLKFADGSTSYGVTANDAGVWSYSLVDATEGALSSFTATASIDGKSDATSNAKTDVKFALEAPAPQEITVNAGDSNFVVTDGERKAGVVIEGNAKPGDVIKLIFGTGDTVVTDAPAADEITDAQDALDAAQAALDEAQAVIDALVATDEEIAALETATTTLSDLQTALETAQTDFEAVDPADAAALAVAQATLDDAQSAVDAGQNEVDAAQAAVDAATTPTEEQQAAVDAATTARDEAQSAVDALAVDTTATDGTDPTATDGTDPTATDGTDPTATDGTDPTATDGTDPTATDGTDPTATDGTDPTVTDPNATDPNATDPAVTDPNAEPAYAGGPIDAVITNEVSTVTVIADKNGHWSYKLTADDFIPEYGTQLVTAIETDKAGNETASTIALVLEDTPPELTLNSITRDGKISAGEKESGVTLSGKTDGTSVNITLGNGEAVAADVVEGVWSYDLTSDDYDLADADNMLSVSVVASDGTKETTVSRDVSVPDTTAPSAPTFDSVDEVVEGTELTGKVDADVAAVTLTFGGKNVANAVVFDSDDTWSYTVTADDLLTLSKGQIVSVKTITATATDAAKNVSVESDAFTIPLPFTVTPEITAVGEDDSLNLADQTELTATITGTAEAGAAITLTFADKTTASAGVADENGEWSYKMLEGDYTPERLANITATASLAGKQSATSEAKTNVVTDFEAPTAPVVTPIDTTVAITAGDEVLLSGTVSVDEGVTSVTVSVNDGDAVDATTFDATTGAWTYKLTTDVTLNSESIVVTALDDALNGTSADALVIDLTPAGPPAAPEAPVIVNKDVNADGVLNIAEAGTTITVTSKLNGVFTADSVELLLDGQPLTDEAGFTEVVDNGVATFTIPAESITEGLEHTLETRVSNSMGETKSDSGTIVQLDLTVATPVADSVKDGKISVTGIEDGASWSYRTDASKPFFAGGTDKVIAFPAGISSLVAGLVEVKQVDEAGNESAVGVNATTLTAEITHTIAKLTDGTTFAGTAGVKDVFNIDYEANSAGAYAAFDNVTITGYVKGEDVLNFHNTSTTTTVDAKGVGFVPVSVTKNAAGTDTTIDFSEDPGQPDAAITLVGVGKVSALVNPVKVDADVFFI